MSLNETEIQWTWTLQPDGTWVKGSTWNPLKGCRRTSPGCGKPGLGSCYAERLIATRLVKMPMYLGLARMTANGPQFTGEHRVDMNVMLDPLRTKKGRRIFVCDMGDLFFEGHTFEEIAMVFAVMLCAHWHTFQVLTKRAKRMTEFFAWIAEKPERMIEACERAGITKVKSGFGPLTMEASPRAAFGVAGGFPWPLPNLWIGVTAEDQQRAEERLSYLLQCPAVVWFVSVEPQCSSVNLRRWMCKHRWRIASGGSVCLDCETAVASDMSLIDEARQPRISWVIQGGWSGPGAGPFDLTWTTDMEAHCKAAGVAYFRKQLGALPVMSEEAWRAMPSTPLLQASPSALRRVPAGMVALKLKDGHGGEMAEWPAFIARSRAFPIPSAA